MCKTASCTCRIVALLIWTACFFEGLVAVAVVFAQKAPYYQEPRFLLIDISQVIIPLALCLAVALSDKLFLISDDLSFHPSWTSRRMRKDTVSLDKDFQFFKKLNIEHNFVIVFVLIGSTFPHQSVFNQSRIKRKPMATSSRALSRAWYQVQVFRDLIGSFACLPLLWLASFISSISDLRTQLKTDSQIQNHRLTLKHEQTKTRK